MLKIGLDIDGTTTACQGLFSLMTEAVKQKGGQVHIVSSRPNDSRYRLIVEGELFSLNIKYDALYLLPHTNDAVRVCPHRELDSYEKFLWQKVDYCKRRGITIFFDDEQKVIDLFHKYAPTINVFKSCRI